MTTSSGHEKIWKVLKNEIGRKKWMHGQWDFIYIGHVTLELVRRMDELEKEIELTESTPRSFLNSPHYPYQFNQESISREPSGDSLPVSKFLEEK